MGKTFGMALLFVMIGGVFWGSSNIIGSTGEVDRLNTIGVTPEAHSNCGYYSTGGSGLQNPAAEYCNEMGYEYKTLDTEAGERGICVLPNGDEIDAWAFYRGECAPEFSYCAKMGWLVAAEAQSDSYSDKCCTCILPDGSHRTVSELLDLGSDGTVAIDSPMDADLQLASLTESQGELPESFDWRDKGGQDWMTPVKDQGDCGSCWAFAAVAMVEAQYNICYGDPTLDLNLSEQYLISDCCANCGNCEGGRVNNVLKFVQEKGITDEDCFPYTATYCSCSKRCLDSNYRLYTIDDMGKVPSDITTMKAYLVNIGPLCASMDWEVGHWERGIRRCDGGDGDSGERHSVVIVGYDEEEDYWIVKNSWGIGWRDDGYCKVGFGECLIENHVYYTALYPREGVIYESHDIDDSVGGDGDGYPEAGESITMSVTLRNVSADTIFIDVSSTLATLTTTPIGPATTVFSENFDQTWPGSWIVGDWEHYSGDDYWGQSAYRAYNGSFSAYCAKVSDVSGQSYDNYMNAFMVRYVDLSEYRLAILSYNYWLDCESDWDHLDAGYFDGSWHWEQIHTGMSSGWVSDSTEIPPTATQVGFRFYSDYSITSEGVYIDDVVLTGYFAPDPYINISDYSSEYSPIFPGYIATGLGAYDLAIDPACPAGYLVIFTLSITASNGGPWTDRFACVIVTPPEVSRVTATQRNDDSGIVDISYDVSDDSRTVDVVLEYWNRKGGWNPCTNAAGDVGPVDTGTDKAVIWNAKAQLGLVGKRCKVRVRANDNSGGIAIRESNTFYLKTGGCFIATAAYGTPMTEEIQILRDFRDEYLLTNPLGQAFVDLYYKVSPPIAEFITEHPSLKPIVRTGLVPVVAMSAVVVSITMVDTAAIVGLLALVLVAVAILAKRRRGRAPDYN